MMYLWTLMDAPYMSSTPQAIVFFQEKCLSHRYIRSNDTSMIFERPQRLRAIKIGVAAAIARLEEFMRKNAKGSSKGSLNPDAVLSTALQRLNLAEEPSSSQDVIEVVMSTASVDILNHPAVKFVHGDIDGDVYLERLVTLVRESEGKVARGESEIPEDLSQTDLYLCGKSLDAIQGAIGTVCEAVDGVFEASLSPSSEASHHPPSKSNRSTRAFVAIRPPGHHCGEDTPSGFCFINNVAVGAAHAHLKHGVTRVVVLDIDLHHGNGTQSIVWQINEEAYRRSLESKEDVQISSPSPLQVYYGSIHDPLSYPCEGRNAAIVQAASVSIHGPQGQHIENVHLLPYQSEADFWDRLYSGPYSRLLEKAEKFLKDSASSGDAMVFISAGFDASEHETASMSRHSRKLPTSFFRKFAHDVRTFADKYAKGRIVSVLEGGYSDRALCSGAMAHLLGLAEDAEVDESWWSVENLIKIEKTTKKRRGGRTSTNTFDGWTERTLSLLADFDPNPSPPPTPTPIPPSTMILRDRNKKADSMSPSSSESRMPLQQSRSAIPANIGGRNMVTENATTHQGIIPTEKTTSEGALGKKLPKVLLRVNPPPGSECPPSQGI